MTTLTTIYVRLSALRREGAFFPNASLRIGLNLSALSGLFFNCQWFMVIFRVYGSAGTGYSPFEGGGGGMFIGKQLNKSLPRRAYKG
ncbi:hypothetical protein EII41_03555 [Tannerella forsythia]|uniref:Uncharacterized protein n=1 Tax=Tannerella forsythia TaxID=28112 RepID=A0A3P1Z2F6_TANFO|nr:hypothetical protein EII41_03555 [Tannerella forsythia]